MRVKHRLGQNWLLVRLCVLVTLLKLAAKCHSYKGSKNSYKGLSKRAAIFSCWSCFTALLPGNLYQYIRTLDRISLSVRPSVSMTKRPDITHYATANTIIVWHYPKANTLIVWHYPKANTLSNDRTIEWVTRPERRTKSSRPEGPPARSRAQDF